MMSQVPDGSDGQFKRLACPRCNSANTKFCYYNNYSLSQPRYFCKACKRYWTKGGSLRNIPAGVGCRRSRRPRPNRSSNNQSRSIIRPDLILYGIAGNIHDMDKVGDRSLHNDNGSNNEIDLALLYGKYLNNSPDINTGASLGSNDNAQIATVMDDVLDLGCVDDYDQLLAVSMLPTVAEEFADNLSLTCVEAPESNDQDFMCSDYYKAYFSSLEALCCGPPESNPSSSSSSSFHI